MKKILAIILAAVLVLSFAACKKNDTNNDTTAGDAQTSGQAADVSASDETASSEEASSEVETEVVTDKEGHTVIETKAPQSSDTKTTTKGNSTTPSKGLNTNDAAACVKAYQEAVKKTKQFKSGRQKMSLGSAITADGGLGFILKLVQGPIDNALAKNSSDRTDIPGNPSGMQASHMKSASAVTNGNYTTITFNVKNQTQGAKADNHSGSVGCAVGTLGNVDAAIKELGFEVDYTNGKIELTYTDCKVVVKIDNTTGKIVDGSWGYKVNVYANGIKVVGYTVKNLKGVVNFSYTAKG